MTMMPSPTIVYHVLTDEMLEKLVTEKAEAKLIDRKKLNDPPLTREQAAKYLKISVRALDRRFENGVLPLRLRHVNGGTTYFFASELNEFIKES